MAAEGQIVLTGPGALPPKAPAGFHWVVIRTIFSDTGGATEWQLVKNQDAGASQFTEELRLDFFRGLSSLLGSVVGVGNEKARQTIVFNGTTSPWKVTWKPTDDWFIVGATAFAGVALSLNPNYANYAAILSAVTGILPSDVLLMIPVSSSIGLQLGDCQIPISKDQPITVYGNVANAMQLFLMPQSK